MEDGSGGEAEIEKTLTGLGFTREDFNRPTCEFSGGLGVHPLEILTHFGHVAECLAGFVGHGACVFRGHVLRQVSNGWRL